MQLHANVKDLMYKFKIFLDNNLLYSSMIIEKEEWEAINIEHEWIDQERRNIVKVKKIMTSKWD
jgi:hypothetical protein